MSQAERESERESREAERESRAPGNASPVKSRRMNSVLVLPHNPLVVFGQ